MLIIPKEGPISYKGKESFSSLFFFFSIRSFSYENHQNIEIKNAVSFI